MSHNRIQRRGGTLGLSLFFGDRFALLRAPGVAVHDWVPQGARRAGAYLEEGDLHPPAARLHALHSSANHGTHVTAAWAAAAVRFEERSRNGLCKRWRRRNVPRLVPGALASPPAFITPMVVLLFRDAGGVVLRVSGIFLFIGSRRPTPAAAPPPRAPLLASTTTASPSVRRREHDKARGGGSVRALHSFGLTVGTLSSHLRPHRRTARVDGRTSSARETAAECVSAFE